MSLELVWVLLAAFCAGGIDAIVGGGGLIQLPALFSALPDAPPAHLLGTNKFAAITGTAGAAWRYTRRITIDWSLLLPLALLVLCASALGAVVATRVPAALFRPLVPVLLLSVLITVLRQPTLGATHQPRMMLGRRKQLAWLLLAGIGFYDGFFGPGTGSFLMVVFVQLYGYDFLHAAASARLLNVATNLAALCYFSASGHVLWPLAVGMAVANLSGAWLGARLALRGGSQWVRAVFIVVVLALIARTLWQVVAEQAQGV